MEPMTPTCEQCGSTEITGRTADAEIELHCQTCGHRWARGARGCASCGGTELLTIPQLITTTPRGNQVSIVGRRQVVVCRDCDCDGVTAYLEHSTPLPPAYQSAARRITVDPTPSPPDAPRRRRTTSPRPTVTRPDPQVAHDDPESAPTHRLTNPTVRQAVEHFQSAEPGQDALVLIMFGRAVGPVSRLSEPQVRQVLATTDDWVAQNFSGSTREKAADTLRAFARHCAQHDWS
ncbi:hypothetical protein [Aeromicrobium sp. CTD01-1L150]|uniref:hypothetical protein n=1 Tax=Aeromicrobium sp. CTD01-1L150 TaxID=3341830 RepID=UPI0035BF2C2A